LKSYVRDCSSNEPLLASIATVTLVLLSCVVPAQGGVVQRVSVATSGTAANQHSWWPSISRDGRYVAFMSTASNLVAKDTNGVNDVFVRDRVLGTTVCASVNYGGTTGNGASGYPCISGDGRFVVFRSFATDLGPRDLNKVCDVYLRDLKLNRTELMSFSSQGKQANGCSYDACLSYDGRLVAFTSLASNLDATDKNGVRDVFLRDRRAWTTTRISRGLKGADSNGASLYPAIAENGASVVFSSGASNLVANDKNNVSDIFLYDLKRNLITRVSVGFNNTEANNSSGRASVSEFGRFVCFDSLASNLIPNDTNRVRDVFVFEPGPKRTWCASASLAGKLGNGVSYRPTISGLDVIFLSAATNLHAQGSGRVLLRPAKKELLLVNRDSLGKLVPRPAGIADLSGFGRHFAFDSRHQLVPEDKNQLTDVYVRTFYPEIAALDSPKIGTNLRLRAHDPAASNNVYLMFTALGWKPGLRIDNRRLYLNPDPLFFLSISLPSVFQRFVGALDSSGSATATFAIPNDRLLIGVSLWSACVTLDSKAPSGILGVSNTVELVLKL